MPGRGFLYRRADRVLENDAEFAANLLRFANSAYASRPVRVRTIRQAVTMAGRVAIGRLAIEAATYRFLEKAPGNGRASVGFMHIHSCAVGSCALELAQRSGGAVEVAHLGGLLHDIGKLVMPIAFGEQALDQIAARATAGPARVALERERLGCDHAQAGAMLALASHVDEPVVAAIPPTTIPTALRRSRLRACNWPTRSLGCRSVPIPIRCWYARIKGLQFDATVLDEVAVHAAQPETSAPLDDPGPGALAARNAALEEQAAATSNRAGEPPQMEARRKRARPTRRWGRNDLRYR